MAGKAPDLPAPGQAFAVPLADGRFAVCRVLSDSPDPDLPMAGTVALVAVSQWIGEVVPDVADPALRPILRLTHHNWKNALDLTWVSDAVPANFVPIGRIPPTPEEAQLKCFAFGSWLGLHIGPLLQWRWDNDRDALLAEEAARKEEEERRRREEWAQRQAALAKITLEGLQGREFFSAWTNVVADEPARKSREIIQDTVGRLIELGKKPTKKARLAVLKQCIESFNKLDESHRFIETIEREDICEAFEEIVQACGLSDCEDLADRWREW